VNQVLRVHSLFAGMTTGDALRAPNDSARALTSRLMASVSLMRPAIHQGAERLILDATDGHIFTYREPGP
jgi:hypothetical protein